MLIASDIVAIFSLRHRRFQIHSQRRRRSLLIAIASLLNRYLATALNTSFLGCALQETPAEKRARLAAERAAERAEEKQLREVKTVAAGALKKLTPTVMQIQAARARSID